MSRTLIILSVFLVGAVLVKARPKVELQPEFQLQSRCISNYDYCRFSVRPCCGKEEVSMFGMIVGEKYTCSTFDSGRCEPIKSFKNIQKHFELVGKLNRKSFEKLRQFYFRDLQRVEREKTAVVVSRAVSTDTEECLAPFSKCHGIRKRCCGRTIITKNDISIGREYTCEVFGSGRCKQLGMIRNLRLHNELVDKLNDTNFIELKSQYKMDRYRKPEQTEGKTTVQPEKLEPSCISNHGYCRFSARPCCGKERFLMFGVMMGEDYTCSVFDTGRCETIQSFKNIQKHMELVSYLNETNFEELRIQYFRDLQRVEKEQTAVEPEIGPEAKTGFMPKCIDHYRPCRGVSKPCCGKVAHPKSSILMGQEYTCAVFDSGLCEPISSFKNIQKHLELVEKLDGNNFEALKIEYKRDLQKTITEQSEGNLDVVSLDKDETQCISNYGYCRFSIRPCCGKEGLPTLGRIVGEDYTCSLFDSGRCEPVSSFKNIHKHFLLVWRLNKTNFDELRIEYFKDLQKVERERSTTTRTAESEVGLEAQPRCQLEPRCIELGAPCRGIREPCCGRRGHPTSPIFMGQEYICSVFGSGRCKPLTSFRNIPLFLELIGKLNDTNFEELSRQYLMDTQRIEKGAAGRPTAE